MLLATNVSYIAHLKNAIGGGEPDLVKSARICEYNGADSILVPFSHENTNITEQELSVLKQVLKSKFHLVMEMNEQNQAFAINLKPDFVCIVPKTNSLDIFETTFNSEKYAKELHEFMIPLLYNKVNTSVYIEPEIDKITAVYKMGLQGAIISARKFATAYQTENYKPEFTQLKEAVTLAQTLGLKVIVDGGVNFNNIYKLREIRNLQEICVGHSVISKAIFDGLGKAVKDLKDIINYEE